MLVFQVGSGFNSVNNEVAAFNNKCEVDISDGISSCSFIMDQHCNEGSVGVKLCKFVR